MRIPLALLLMLLFTASAEAQIFKVRFKDEKAAKKYKKYTAVIDGETVFLGQAVPQGGVILDFDKQGQFKNATYKSARDNEFFAFDPKDPSKVPYRMVDGEPEPLKKSSVVAIHGKHIASLGLFMRSETIETVAREYRLRLGRVEQLEQERDELDKGSVEWFASHARMLSAYDRLLSWLDACSFELAAGKLRKARDKEAKVGTESATRVRAQRAQDSVEMLGTTDELAQATQAAGGSAYTFKIQQSQHLRITYETGLLEDERIADLLRFGERVIESFRNQFVDPYVGETFAEQIPDTRFQEFYFGPDDRSFHEKFLVEYYKNSWNDKARQLDVTGNWFSRSVAPRWLMYRRLLEHSDLEGDLCHNLGHTLAGYHFNGTPAGMQQDWMEEGLGYYLSFEFTGRNTVTCLSFDEGKYVAEEAQRDRKKVQMGYRDIMNASARNEGPRVDRLMVKKLFEMENGDISKSWSFFEYVARRGGAKGQRWMRAACKLAGNRATFLEELRKVSEELYEVSGENVYIVLDDLWRGYAETEQVSAE